jgi:hypothetical protein
VASYELHQRGAGLRSALVLFAGRIFTKIKSKLTQKMHYFCNNEDIVYEEMSHVA